MRVQAKLLLLFFLVNSSQQTCQVVKETISNYGKNRRSSYLSCTDITPSYDLNSDILSKSNASINTIIISNSSMPELTQNLFQGINATFLQISAKVEIVQSKALEYCNISSFVLDGNDVRLIKYMSFNSAMIQYLSLQNNSLTEIKIDNFFGLRGLKQLNLKYNKIEEIAESAFDSLTSLEELDLSFNQLVELHFALFQTMTSLRIAYLNNNLLKSLSNRALSQCKTLKFLYIQNNRITIIDSRYYPTTLAIIKANNNELTAVDFSNLVNLDTLDLNSNNLTKLIGGIYNLPALRFLFVNDNQLGPFIHTQTLHHLKNLTRVTLDGNGLQKIDFELFEALPALLTVTLTENDLSGLDLYNVNNDAVMVLNLSSNSLSGVKNLSRLEHLQKLDISCNKLQEIHYDMLANLGLLVSLQLQYNSIQVLHMGCFRDLKSLRELNLSHNSITDIELGAFTGLKMLMKLDVSYNSLTHLDENIFHNTRHLSVLNIAYNNLKQVDIKSIATFWLRSLTLGGNSWSCKSLAELVRKYPSITITPDAAYNVTNVFGVACNNTEEGTQVFNNSKNVSQYLGNIEEYTKKLSGQMSLNNWILLVLVIVFCVNFTGIFGKCFTCFAVTRQYLYTKYRNEEDHMQLT
ncbi:hypothetical protein NQ315_008688 [Exocentrus adspersus]|uniref:Toll-like receptor 3 n=1 Tax=Exocentrus adspersus TaxID=1586481 RepID=A0AAV8W6T9_9CUCU|nr:hypothetical protein NQ315_008688 [Exocentrus adspersus]